MDCADAVRKLASDADADNSLREVASVEDPVWKELALTNCSRAIDEDRSSWRLAVT